MASKRKSKMITNPDEIKALVDLKEEDITLSFIMETFGEFDGKRKYNPYDIVTIPANSYGPNPQKKNKNSFTTTVGLFIYNKFFFENELFDLFHYINKSVDNDLFGDINKKLSYALLEDKIPLDYLKHYLNKTQKIMPYVTILAPNYTDKMLTCSDAIKKKKEELLAKNKEALDRGDEVVGNRVEKELLQYALDYMGDDPSMDVYNSKARGTTDNNFKNIFVVKGVIKDPDPYAKQKYKFATSNYIDGIKADEYSLIANSLAAGPFKRARKTADGGYWEKLFVYTLQHVTLDAPGSDCHTKDTVEVHLTKKNVSFWMYSYIVDKGKLVELTSENVDNYLNKVVKFRFASMCESKTGICNKCAGNMLYRIGIKNAGITESKIPSTLKNISMKSFHDSTEQLTEIPLDTVFGEWEDK
jgi:hypothetical protein